MFDLNRQVRLKQAKNALRDGRLDEAFSIATETAIRELRGGQVLLEQLVKPLLERAARHLCEERLTDALLDAERAVTAGGSRPEALALKTKIEDALAARKRADGERGAVIASARRHVKNGDLARGRERLQDAPSGDPAAAGLSRELENREQKLLAAQDRAQGHLGRGELLEALSATQEAIQAAGRREALGIFLSELREAVAKRIEGALQNGELKAASQLAKRFRACLGESLESHRFEDALALAEKGAKAFACGDHEGARVALTRLQRILPQAAWVEEHARELAKVAGGLRLLSSGPLAELNSARLPKIEEEVTSATVVGEPPAPREEGVASGSRFLLWVDGVGTYLILTTSRTSVGRAGSSTRPDIGLSADIAGYHAEILRLEDDYFVVAGQGSVKVGDQAIQRKLLSSGDTLEFGSRCRMTFRLPTAMSTSAVLTLREGQRLEKDVREIILLDEHFLLGPRRNCHVETRGSGEPVILSLRENNLVCRAKEEVLVDGKSAGRDAEIPLGASVQIGDLTFTVTLLGEGEI